MAPEIDVLDLLKQLGAVPANAVYLRAGAGEEAIRKLQVDARKHLGEEVPESYVRLLRFSNGMQVNGAFFKEAENLVLENLDVPRPEIIVLGNEGNVAQYVFDKRDQRFHTINMGFPDERFASFETFEGMLLTVFREQQVWDDPGGPE